MSTCDPKDLPQINNGEYVIPAAMANTIRSSFTSQGNDVYLKLGDTTLTEDALKELLQLRGFMDYIAQSDTKVGDLWTAYKTKQRIT
jgi:hypothetical protein